MNKAYTLDVKENDAGEQYIEFPDGVMEELGWKEGDSIEWSDNGDGSFTLTKKEPMKKKIVLVDCIAQHRMRYAVELNEGDPDEWALDTVVCEEAKEFSQDYLGEVIVSHRVITREEYLEQYTKDNEYSKSWSDEVKFRNGLTTQAEIESMHDNNMTAGASDVHV